MSISECLDKLFDQAIDNHALMVEGVIKNKCINCKYAKTCNPKRNVDGIEMRRELVPAPSNLYFSGTFKIEFVCRKFSLRKNPVAWNETRIYKIAQSIKEETK